MDAMQKLIEDTMKAFEKPIPEKEQAKYKEVMSQIFQGGINPKDALGFNDEMLEHMYAYGYRLYNLGSYRKARDVFLALVIFNPDDPRFHLAVASAYHKLQDYSKAITSYFHYASQEVDDPLPYFFMYDCYMQTKFLEDATFCLEEVVRRAGTKEDFQALKEKCKLMLASLKTETNTQPKEDIKAA
jgi:type III secretion system low calcium response chaperone LcrH/SycD